MDQIEKNTVSAKKQIERKVWIENAEGRGTRILFVGNSITRHAVKEDIGWFNDWGMAASSEEKDYVHIIEKAVLNKDPDAVFCICQAADWEDAYERGEETYPLYADAREFRADIIIMRIVENCPAKRFNKEVFQEEYLKFMQYLNPDGKAKVILTSSFWKKVEDGAIKEIAEEKGLDFVYLGDLGECPDMRADGLFEHSGVACHPGDQGMQKIAERILERME